MRERIVSFLTSDKMEPSSLSAYVGATFVLGITTHFALRLIQHIYRGKRNAEALKEFPGPPGHWLFGNVKEMLASGDILGYHVKCTEKYNVAYTFNLGLGIHQLRVSHPDSVKSMLNSEPKDNYVYTFLEPWLGEGLLLSGGQKWRRNRHLLTPAFHFEILRPYVAIFSQSANILVDNWKAVLNQQEKSVEVFKPVSLMTLDSLMKCIFDYHGDCQNESFTHPYIQSVYELTALVPARTTNILCHSDLIYHLTWNGYKFRRACRTVHKYSQHVIRNKRKNKMTNEELLKKKKYLSFLDILLNARDENGVGLTDNEIQNEVDTFMFEGHDTTAAGISWCLYNLACHPKYQTQCREEVNSVLGDRTDFCWDDMSKLPFLTMCLKESLRITPPVPFVGRKVTKSTPLPDGRIIPAGIMITVSIYGCHHNPEVWENPATYDPYRFTPDNIEKRQHYAYIPFSAGPRNCIGQHFAMNEMKTAIGLIIRNFEISRDEDRLPKKIPSLTLKAKGGLWLKLKPIETKQT